MQIKSVNVGKPAIHEFDGVKLETSMHKFPQEFIQVNELNIDGDVFKSPNFHGIPDAVVYALSTEIYPDWSKTLEKEIPLGLLGENLSVENLIEADFKIGDIYSAGEVQLQVTGPRYPCNRLNYVTGNHKMRDLFLNDLRPGVYFKVLKPGIIKKGERLILSESFGQEVSILDIYNVMRMKELNIETEELLNKVLACRMLTPHFRSRLERLKK